MYFPCTSGELINLAVSFSVFILQRKSKDWASHNSTTFSSWLAQQEFREMPCNLMVDKKQKRPHGGSEPGRFQPLAHRRKHYFYSAILRIPPT